LSTVYQAQKTTYISWWRVVPRNSGLESKSNREGGYYTKTIPTNSTRYSCCFQ